MTEPPVPAIIHLYSGYGGPMVVDPKIGAPLGRLMVAFFDQRVLDGLAYPFP